VPHDFNATILDVVAHRPWEMPARPWVMTQTWLNLLFAHWPVDRTMLRALVPAALELDLFDDVAWVGVVPFYMTNVSPRGVPAMPWVSEFPELNVRTYVRAGRKPGVYFFSLDASRALAVRAARLLLNLPYQHATMSVESRDGAVSYESRRNDGRAEFRARYRAIAPSSFPVAGSLEYFLTERYCLYHLTRSGRPYRLEIHHPPWPLQTAEADIERNTMASASGLTLPSEAPLLHFASRQDMVAWPPDYLAPFTASIC